jgi:methionyl-tRNA formyltransferase
LIDWYKTATEIHNLIRGLSPYPAAFTKLDEKVLKIYASSKDVFAHNKEIGSHETDGKTYFKFFCKDGAIFCNELQLEGKKKMKVDEFLRGYKT